MEQSWRTLRRRALRSIRRRLLRIQAGIRTFEQQLYENQQYEATEHLGNLLKSILHTISNNATRTTAYDWLAEKEVSIALNPKYPPQQQAELYFKKMKKQKKSLVPLQNALSHLHTQHEFWENALTQVREAKNEASFFCLHRTLSQQRATKKEGAKKAAPFFMFRSESGCEIYVGRDAASSELLTFQKAKKDDLWLHVSHMSGPHVIIKKPSAKPIDDEAIWDAANVALYWSKARGAPHKEYEVVLCERKHVHRCKGHKKGRVTLSQFSTRVLMLDPQRIARLRYSSSEKR